MPKLLLLAMLVSTSILTYAEIKPDLEGFQKGVQPLIQKYCVDCHGAEKQKGDMRLDNIDPDLLAGEHFDQWEDIREAFNSGEMPPEKKAQPTVAERSFMTEWMDAEFKKVKLQGSSRKRGSVRRLTRYELQYALEDLLQVSVEKEVNLLPEEGTSIETGLKDSSRLLMISSPHLESYLDVVLSIINRMKTIAVYEPFGMSADIANLDVNPPQQFTSENKKIRPVLAKLKRSGKGVIMDSGGYLDVPIPAISKYKFITSILAKADSSGNVEVGLGFQRSDVDTRQINLKIGMIGIQAGEELQNLSLESYPEDLTDEFTRGDRPFYLRITNRGAKNLYIEDLDYQGNVNQEMLEALVPRSIKESEIDSHVRQKVTSFITKAFRRPPTQAESQKYLQVFQNYAKDESPAMALLSTYKEILCTPKFFYLGLPGSLQAEENRNFKLAERLATFLWCSVPDEPLLKAAAEGKLTKPSELTSQVERMLKDGKSRRWVERFADQWLQTSQLGNVAVDRTYYPKFRDTIKELMHQETYEAINDVFRKGSSALDLLKADHVFVNQTLAAFYKLRGVRGEGFRKVPVDEKSNRGGLLTQATFLIGNSDGMNSHAILRGVWLAEVILHDPPPDPPANVPPLDETIPGFDKMTLNEKLFHHRNNEACKSCHLKIDPWGIPFENYDASGAWRDKVLVVSKAAKQPKQKKKKPVFEKSYVEIERKTTLPDGVTVDGMGKLKEYLVTHRKRDFAQGLVERILAYALSRDIDFHDEDLVYQLVDRFETNNYSVPSLIIDIVQNDKFQEIGKPLINAN